MVTTRLAQPSTLDPTMDPTLVLQGSYMVARDIEEHQLHVLKLWFAWTAIDRMPDWSEDATMAEDGGGGVPT